MLATVRGAELKSCFIDMSSLLKKYDRAKVFGIEATKDKITFTVDTGISYTRSIDVISGSEMINMSLTVLFADISHFLPARSEITLDITQFCVRVIAPGATMTLQIGESIVAPYVPRRGALVDLDYAAIRGAYKVFSGTADLQKAYGRDFAITMYGDYALMRSPTLWIRTKSQGLVSILSMEQLKSIVTFQPDFVEESDRLEFHKGNAILSIPKLAPTEADKFNEHINGMKLTTLLRMSGVVKELLEVKRAFGVGEAQIHLHKEGFHMSMSKGGITLEESYNVSGDSVFSFRYMLDIFIMCLNILGEDVDINIYTKEGLVCLESTATSILISV